MAELLQTSHLLVLAIILFLLFGGPRVASLGRGFAEGIRNFRSELKRKRGINPPS